MKRLALLAPVLGLATLLAGCGSSGPSDDAAAAASGAAASGAASGSASVPAAAFNPCDSLSARRISKALGVDVSIEKGTADTPRCALLPAQKNGPTFELSYLRFDGGLEAAWKTMQVPTGTVTTPTVANADAARQVVQQSSDAYAVSAFLQNGNLIQSLNGMALAPYRVKAMERATAEILRELSAGAPAA